MANMAVNDNRTLLELAVDAHDALMKLAAGLAHAGANPQATGLITKMASGVGQVTKILGSAPDVAQAQQPQAPPEAGAAPAQAQGAPAPAQGEPPTGPRPGERPNGLHNAALHLTVKHG
jgi:hypothetical protein